MSPRRAFTLIEMLLVVAIIALIIALLLPNLGQAREVARNVQCRANMHHISLGFYNLSRENKNRLPGLWGAPWTGSDPIEGSFMGKEVFLPHYQPAPASKLGTLVPFIGGEQTARELYRCPSLPVGVFRSGVGSNGMFDVTMMQALPGARINTLPTHATYIDPANNQSVTVPLPVVIEENPAFGINKDFVDMGHTSINRFGSTHFRNGGNYMSSDGSAHRLVFAGSLGPEGHAWNSTTKAGTTNLGIARNYGTFR